MPSPFPGMDPYLEDPKFWPDAHSGLVAEIRSELNRVMPKGYSAQSEYRYEMDILIDDDPRDRQVRDADVALTSSRKQPRRDGGTAVLESPRREITERVEVVATDPTRRAFVEIRKTDPERRLVTVLEILSPSNKRPGDDRDAFATKQRETIGAGVHFVTIDLLREGERQVFGPESRRRVERMQPRPDYLVTVDIAGCEGVLLKTSLYPASIREMLPCIGVPLSDGDPNVPLDLQYVFQNTYDAGPYPRGAVDYTKPPRPPLSGEDADWAWGLVRVAD